MRVELRSPAAQDAAVVDLWLPEAISAVSGRSLPRENPASLSRFLEELAPSQRAWLVARDRLPIGLAVNEQESHDAVRIDFLAMAAQERNLGFGAEAVLLLERQFAGRSLQVGIPMANGLAIYFWLRTGYRPIYPRDSIGSLPADRFWMTRRPDGPRPAV